jgi:HNH endonuclease
MATSHNVSVSVLRQLLRYEPETGKLFWLERDVRFFADGKRKTASQIAGHWNGIWAGKPAFTSLNRSGHCIGAALGSRLIGHRVAYAMHHGIELINIIEIDHINGNPADNRISNLRHVTHKENARNVGIYKNNKSGHHGVCWDAGHKAWKATIGENGKQKRLGRFKSFEQAVAVRKNAEIESGYHQNHGRLAPLP